MRGREGEGLFPDGFEGEGGAEGSEGPLFCDRLQKMRIVNIQIPFRGWCRGGRRRKVCFSRDETAFGRVLQLRAGGVPVASCGDSFHIGIGDQFIRRDEGGFIDRAVGAGDFFRRVDIGVKGAEGDLAAEISKVGFCGSVWWRRRGWGPAVGRICGVFEGRARTTGRRWWY